MKITEYANPEDFLLVLKENTGTSYENPTSNSIYQKIGYRQIGNYAIYDFFK